MGVEFIKDNNFPFFHRGVADLWHDLGCLLLVARTRIDNVFKKLSVCVGLLTKTRLNGKKVSVQVQVAR